MRFVFRVDAPRIARKRRAGQFVILRVNETGERIPLTIADADADAGSITIIVQGVGKTTKMLNDLYVAAALAITVLGAEAWSRSAAKNGATI